jgi:hypothetical protein
VEILTLRDDDDEQRHLLSKLKGQDGPIEGCRWTLVELEQLFPKTIDTSNSGQRQKLAPSLTALAWPFKRNHAARLLDEIS